MDAFQILVIVLSTLLGFILFFSIIAIIIVIKIIKDIKHITEKAADAADNIEHAALLFKKTTSLAAITKVLGNAVEMFSNKRNKGRD